MVADESSAQADALGIRIPTRYKVIVSGRSALVPDTEAIANLVKLFRLTEDNARRVLSTLGMTLKRNTDLSGAAALEKALKRCGLEVTVLPEQVETVSDDRPLSPASLSDERADEDSASNSDTETSEARAQARTFNATIAAEEGTRQKNDSPPSVGVPTTNHAKILQTEQKPVNPCDTGISVAASFANNDHSGADVVSDHPTRTGWRGISLTGLTFAALIALASMTILMVQTKTPQQNDSRKSLPTETAFVLDYVFRNRWQVANFPCDGPSPAFTKYGRDLPLGEVLFINGKPAGNLAGLEKRSDFRYEITGKNSFTLHQKLWAKGDSFMTETLGEPNAIIMDKVTEYTLENPKLLSYSTRKYKFIDLRAAMRGQRSYADREESGQSNLCE